MYVQSTIIVGAFYMRTVLILALLFTTMSLQAQLTNLWTAKFSNVENNNEFQMIANKDGDLLFITDQTLGNQKFLMRTTNQGISWDTVYNADKKKHLYPFNSNAFQEPNYLGWL